MAATIALADPPLDDLLRILNVILASRAPGESLELQIQGRVTSLARSNPEAASRLIEEANLPDTERRQMLKKARDSWNWQKVMEGNWDQIIPAEGTDP